MTVPGPLPSLSELQSWPTEHFDAIAEWCDAEADRWESCYTAAHQQTKAADWEGQAHDNAVQRLETDLGKARGGSTALRDVSKILRLGGENERFAKAAALRAVAEARNAGFTVGEDLSVTDTMKYASFEQYVARRDQAREIAAEIRAQAASLMRIDQDIAARLPAAAAGLRAVRFDESKGHKQVRLVDDIKEGPGGPLPEDQNPYPVNDVIAEATDLDGNRIILRRGYYDAATQRGWGWDKAYWKHGVVNPNVFKDLISHSRPVRQPDGTLRYDIPINRAHCTRGPLGIASCTDTGESLTMRIVVDPSTNRPDVPDGRQKGVITMFPLPGGSGVIELGPKWTWTPPWVNNNVPIN